MQTIVNTDNHVHGTHDLADKVADMVKEALGHHTSHITRVEVHLADVNSAKGGDKDKKCTLEARLEGHQPVATHFEADTMAKAIDGASRKLSRVIASTVGKLSTH